MSGDQISTVIGLAIIVIGYTLNTYITRRWPK
jgi:hypothetical protein